MRHSVIFGHLAKFNGFLKRFSSNYGAGAESSTIYAVATGGIRSALSVIRVSGPETRQVVEKIGKYSSNRFPKPREATLRKFYDPVTSSLLDHGIILYFPNPNSYTGEDCCEFHIHGGPSVITGMLKAIGSIGCRMAEPGEFTRRAFVNGKMDLTEIDGLADLISAETEMQRVQALKQMDGSLSRIYLSWRDRLAKCLANSEAFIDFGEDENIESDVMDQVVEQVKGLINNIEGHLKDQNKGQRLKDGIRVAIIGQPNVGKSTLLNKLCQRDAAIVSNVPGTTRDVIESCVNVHGFPVIFCDTAGIRNETCDQIETEGIRRSLKQVEEADLILFLVDCTKITKVNKENFLRSLSNGIENMKDRDGKSLLPDLINKTILIANKVDLSEKSRSVESIFDCSISCKTNQGFEQMDKLLKDRITDICGDPTTDNPSVTRERYRIELERCINSLREFVNFSHSSDLALRTHCLKEGINALGSITGHVGTEQILDIVFRDFCIGK